MLGIKPFVQDSVQGLPPAQLKLLAETLRIDLRGCEDRGDIERILTGLVCMDQDTSLGVFLSWLRSADLQQHKSGIFASKKPRFNTTFLPAIASSAENRSIQQTKSEVNNPLKDHHLDDEIQQQLVDLEVLETSFKNAERLVHTGSPSFEKLKQFLLQLTKLRAKEQTTRVFLVRQSKVLKEQHEEMRTEMLHSRTQLEFFVEGFTNLRKRHDALLVDATRMKAESETTQDIFVSMSAHDCHFEQLMHNTLRQQMRDNDEMKKRLQEAQDNLDTAAQKRKELEAQISQLKQERGDAQKDAYCYKRQLRVCKLKMTRLQEAGGGADGSFFRSQTVTLRQTVAKLLGLLRDSILKDTKSLKQTLSKEVLRLLYQMLTPNITASENDTQLVRDFNSDNEADCTKPRVVHRQTCLDIDQVIRGVLLVEGATSTDAAECAFIMGEKLKYLPIDLKQTLAQLQLNEENEEQAIREEEQRKRRELQESEGQNAADTAILPINLSFSPVESRPQPTLEAYAVALKKYVFELMQVQGKRGFVMYNWPFSRRDVNLLIALGLPIDSIINLEIVGGVQVSVSSSTTTAAPLANFQSTVSAITSIVKPKTPVSATKFGGKAPVASSASRGKASPTKPTTASKSSVKPANRTTTKPRAASPPRPSGSSPNKATSTVSTSASMPQTPSTPATSIATSSVLNLRTTETLKVKKIPTAASALQGLGGLLQSVKPAAFLAERVDAILHALELQKRRKLAPIVQWDEATRCTNEMLAMWAEEMQMLMHLEQESRKPQKSSPGTPLSPSKPTTVPKVATNPPKVPTKASSKPTRSPTKSKATSTIGRALKK